MAPATIFSSQATQPSPCSAPSSSPTPHRRGSPLYIAAVAAATAVIEAITVIILSAHYTMDVFAAPFAAYGADEIARRFAPHVDAWLGRLG
ncbi:MAG: hypothetical protein NTX09_08505 [Verrucomicrobia bacterium]|nr:hypothetical protein [Verrucomicrobiota bacterium]